MATTVLCGSASRSFPVYPVVSTATIIFIIQAATEWSTIWLANIMPILSLRTNMYIIVYTYIYIHTHMYAFMYSTVRIYIYILLYYMYIMLYIIYILCNPQRKNTRYSIDHYFRRVWILHQSLGLQGLHCTTWGPQTLCQGVLQFSSETSEIMLSFFLMVKIGGK